MAKKDMAQRLAILAQRRERFLGASDLAFIFDVDVSIILAWADVGAVACFRAPGGSLKFNVADVTEIVRRVGAAYQAGYYVGLNGEDLTQESWHGIYRMVGTATALREIERESAKDGYSEGRRIYLAACREQDAALSPEWYA